jgi:hypothetical protein
MWGWLSRWPSARWGLATATVAFLPVMVGLLTADRKPSSAAWLVAALATIGAGGVGAFQAHQNESSAREDRAMQQTLEDQNDELTKANNELAQAKERLEIARAQANAALGQTGRFLLDILLHRNQDSLNRIVQFLLESLHLTFSDRGRLLITFLQYHGGSEYGLPEPTSGSHKVSYSIRSQAGALDIGHSWQIEKDSQDDEVALRVLSGKPPWEKGILISDLTAPNWANQAVLRLPGSNGKVGSYCRIPLALAGKPLGFLCIDAESPGALDWKDYETVEPLAAALATGFGIFKFTTKAAKSSPAGKAKTGSAVPEGSEVSKDSTQDRSRTEAQDG